MPILPRRLDRASGSCAGCTGVPGGAIGAAGTEYRRRTPVIGAGLGARELGPCRPRFRLPNPLSDNLNPMAVGEVAARARAPGRLPAVAGRRWSAADAGGPASALAGAGPGGKTHGEGNGRRRIQVARPRAAR
ncbi:hypothetical protein [Mycolicibacter minnesotensis]